MSEKENFYKFYEFVKLTEYDKFKVLFEKIASLEKELSKFKNECKEEHYRLQKYSTRVAGFDFESDDLVP